MMPAAAAKQESGGNEENISSWNSTWSRLKDPRIVRVSRAMGGKDRHSKVCTVRGLRDRRVRLSVPTAIQLYDLQERLGLNQPSKVVDWLLTAAKNEIDELPPLQIPQGISFSQMLINPSSSSSSQKHHHHHHHHSTNFDKFKDVGGETNTHHHQSWTTSTDQNEYELENNFVSRQNNIPSSSASSSFSSHPFIDSFGRWDPASNLTLSHTPISLGLMAAQHQDFSINASQQQQVLVYQPYFAPQMNMNMNAAALFDSKQPSFHASEISAASSSLTTATVRPFSFNMTTTADLLPSQRNAVDDDDLHSS